MKVNEYSKISAEKFQFVQKSGKIYDEKFDTKPIGYFKDAWIRFKKSIGSVIAAGVLVLIVLFAVFGPVLSKFDMLYSDTFFKNALPKNELLSRFGFWDGTKTVELNSKQYKYYTEQTPETGYVLEVLDTYEKTSGRGTVTTYYEVVVDSYKQTGFVYNLVSAETLADIKAYEQESGVQLMYPLLADYTYSTEANGDVRAPQLEYALDENGQMIYEADRDDGVQYQIRVLNYEYFVYEHGYEPTFIFGSNTHGQDIFVRLAVGARLSLILGLTVAICIITIGLVYGSVEGYYGGTADLLMQRFVEILNALPFIVLAMLFQMHLADSVGVVGTLIFAYVSVGWIATSDIVRQQFYRYKNREYVLASRTLGAKDRRLIFRHILPNAIGPVITSTVLVIPGVIFGEAMLSYLGIIDLSTSTLTSIGSLLADGQQSMRNFPHIIFFPALFISILMISFNVFGNGLRDAFNPSLRGVEE